MRTNNVTGQLFDGLTQAGKERSTTTVTPQNAQDFLAYL
jgi:hypothetical protein